MTASEIRGICPIVDTPFTDDGEIDYENLRRLVARLAESGVNSLAVFGFASEYYALSDDERRAMAEVVVEECAGTGTTSIVSITPHATKHAIEEAEFAEQIGADALMVLPPHIRLSASADVLDHISAVADAVSVPVGVQYAPEEGGVALSPGELADLYRTVDNVEYFKVEAKPPGGYVTSLLEETDGEATVLVGNAGFEMIDAFDRGAAGVMPASAMYDVYQTIYDRYQQGDREEAIDIHGDLLQMLTLIGRVGIQFEKEILARRGMADTAHCREPVNSPDEHYTEQFEYVYETYLAPHFRDRT
ncbi:dihydrodipicolinate synthase family protein [Halovenus marina]|uniref:dihydrodipicolinate synthase family protein n=1 Tax=Halovenus marina TaxID=3396621 RepID=UPI003F5687B6